MHLFLLSFHRTRVQQRTRLATVAANRASSGRVLQSCTRGRGAVFDTMPRDTASRGWSPGDPVLFDSSVLPGPARQPLGAVKHAKQKDDSSTKPALPRQRQSTLSPWAKAAWQPGMRVVIATSNKSKRSTALIEEEEHRSNAHRVLKGKQRLVAEDEKENVHLKKCAVC